MTPSHQRTRSRRWRSGSRRNKHHPIAHIELCPEPKICIVHHRHPWEPLPKPAPMRMRLTRCEQKWVDDVRAGRRHVHTRSMRDNAIQAIVKRSAEAAKPVPEAKYARVVTAPIQTILHLDHDVQIFRDELTARARATALVERIHREGHALG